MLECHVVFSHSQGNMFNIIRVRVQGKIPATLSHYNLIFKSLNFGLLINLIHCVRIGRSKRFHFIACPSRPRCRWLFDSFRTAENNKTENDPKTAQTSNYPACCFPIECFRHAEICNCANKCWNYSWAGIWKRFLNF